MKALVQVMVLAQCSRPMNEEKSCAHSVKLQQHVLQMEMNRIRLLDQSLGPEVRPRVEDVLNTHVSPR